MTRLLRFVPALGCALALWGCTAHPAVVPNVAGPDRPAAATVDGQRAGVLAPPPIDHVVFVIQENRSFDNLFQGYPHADTVSSGLDSSGNTIPLQPIPLEAGYDIGHGLGEFLHAYDGGKMDGFDLEDTDGDTSPYTNPQYGYVPHAESKLYFEMAHRYVLGDRMFTSQIDASYISHQYAIAAQANRAVNFPNLFFGCDREPANVINTLNADRTIGPTEPTCQNYRTLGDELDRAGRSWRYYTFGKSDWLWTGYGSIRHIRRGPDWAKDVIAPSRRFLDDVGHGRLANVTWVTPSGPNSDHSSTRSNTGPMWVARVVNAVGESKYWKTTAIFVMWDEWGGWYDHVPPPYADFDGLGIRVPLLVISPYAKRDYVSHVQYETGSVLRFIEDEFGLGRLAASDTRANSPAADCFDFTRPPRPFVPFVVSAPIEPPSARADVAPDDE